ncbi:hypothetical protein KAS08_04795 [Candidatus Pacearchaeota archaeon]|nr:hypothetical protein [Candidatus Pacearchaeota archaeon]
MVIKWQGEKTEPEQEVVVVESTENIVSRRTSLVLSIVSLAISLMFLSQNITGNVVANFSTNGANWIGGIFFILAIIGGLIYVDKSKV